jgi:Nitroreductase
MDTAIPFDPHFTVNALLCTKCGACVGDCVAGIIAMTDTVPAIAPELRDGCIGCQHCLTVCPEGAVSILGLDPADSIPLKGEYYDPARLELLIRGRRSVRQFSDEPVKTEVLDKLLEGMSYAPTGVNYRKRKVSVITNKDALAVFRDKTMFALKKAIEGNRIPEPVSWIADFADDWFSKGKDGVFRNAPHLITVSTPNDLPTGTADSLIALSYFDLLAQSYGVGTVWGGLIYAIIGILDPSLRRDLGIPDDYQPGYCMLFGNPSVHYARTAQHVPEDVIKISE